MRQLLAPIALLSLLAPGMGFATPVWSDSTRTQAQIEAVAANATNAKRTIGQMAGILHLNPPDAATPAPERPLFAEGPAGSLISTDLQLAMTQLSIHIGSNNQIRVLRAQGDRRDALILESGFSTLKDVAKTAEAQGLDGIRLVDGVVELSRPLVVWLGAGLRLEPDDHLLMDAATGAFLLGFGQIEMIDADVRAVGTKSAAETYRPFVLITGQGTIYAEGTQFSGLGMVDADPFGGLVVSSRGLFPPQFPPTLIGNSFDDLGVLSLVGVVDGVIADNLVKSGRGGGITLSTVQGARVADNAVIGTKGGAGVKVTNGTNVALTGNLVSAGARNGISIGGNSKGVKISGNAVLTNAETGIATQRATCILVADNSVARNGASGLRLNASGISRVQGNALVMNSNSGLNVVTQRKGGRIEVADNLLAGNRVGLSGVAIGEVELDQNNLSAQMPRLFDGEFSQHLSSYLTQVQLRTGESYLISGSDKAETDTYLTACNKG